VGLLCPFPSSFPSTANRLRQPFGQASSNNRSSASAMSTSSAPGSPPTPQEATTPPTPNVESDGDETDTPTPDGTKAKKKSKPKKKKKKAVVAQSDPPRVGLSQIYKDNVYPEGEIQEYIDEYVVSSSSIDKTLEGKSARLLSLSSLRPSY
jgi:hypothetical protein